MFYLVIKGSRVVEKAQSQGGKITDVKHWQAYIGRAVEDFVQMLERNRCKWVVQAAPFTKEQEDKAVRAELFKQ